MTNTDNIHQFKVGDRVTVEDTGCGETGPDGRPIGATIQKLDWDTTVLVRFNDGDEGWYGFEQLTPA